MPYVAIPPRAFVSETDTPEHRPTCEVFEANKAPVKTGLLSADGWPLYRCFETVPLGFVGPVSKSRHISGIDTPSTICV